MSDDFDALADKIKRTPFDTERLMTQLLFIVLANSQKRTPVRTGTLRRSETTRTEAQGTRGFIGTNVVYAPFVHYGTRRQTAQPFFEQGASDSRTQINALLAKTGDTYIVELSKP